MKTIEPVSSTATTVGNAMLKVTRATTTTARTAKTSERLPQGGVIGAVAHAANPGTLRYEGTRRAEAAVRDSRASRRPKASLRALPGTDRDQPRSGTMAAPDSQRWPCHDVRAAAAMAPSVEAVGNEHRTAQPHAGAAGVKPVPT